MINISRLLGGTDCSGDNLRYADGAQHNMCGAAHGTGPVVVWNCTGQCNLRCRHCYSADGSRNAAEMSESACREFIDDLAAFKVPVLLFSGGEPLMRKDFFKLLEYARQNGIRCAVSTNGTLITPELAARLKSFAVSYVGISLDGSSQVHDRFRGCTGSFDLAVQGIKNCTAVGQKLGLRVTINNHNWDKLDEMFALADEMEIERICFYHYVPAGRGSENREDGIDHYKTRLVVDKLMKKAQHYKDKNLKREILTVDNHADAVYLYLKMCKTDKDAAQSMLALLARNGGNRSGSAIAAVDWLGNVYPDQFTRSQVVGNISDKPFSAIWSDGTSELLSSLRCRKDLLKGRCAQCRWLDICNGNLRGRAYALTGDFWSQDPACYLTNEEILSGRII